MADVQPQFQEFDGTIRLGRFEENETLREKRDVIQKKVDKNLPDVFQSYGESIPTWEWFDQGSYDLGTGIKPPADCDFDIDQGLYFGVSTSKYPDPVVLKQRLHESLNGHTDEVRIRRSCVTVQYHKASEPCYHVDIAVFSAGASNFDGKDRIAVGRETSAPSEREWRTSNPSGLKDLFWARFLSGPDRDQFRRCVRYLKRWKDHNFVIGNAAPTGIALTVAAYNDLGVCFADPFTKAAPVDLAALQNLVRRMLARFEEVWNPTAARFERRLRIMLPVEPWPDLLQKMTENQMREFESQLGTLRDALDVASGVADPVEACKRLQRVFGPDFPVPERKDTAKRHAPAVASSSSSA